MSNAVITTLKQRRQAIIAQRDALLTDMTPDRFTPQVEARANGLMDEADELRDRISDLEQQDQREARAASVRKVANGGAGSAYVSRDAEVYRPDEEHSFFRDVH